MNQMMQDVEYERLPRLIQDAVTVTRRLDVKYLWIDAFCIVQGDSEGSQSLILIAIRYLPKDRLGSRST